MSKGLLDSLEQLATNLLVSRLNVRSKAKLANHYSPPGGGDKHSFVRGGSAPRSKPSPFYIPFLTEKVPLSYTC